MVILNKQVYFDFLKGVYHIGVREADSPQYYELGGEYVDSTEWQSMRIPNRILADFITLPKTLAERNTTKIAVYQSTPDDIFPPLNSSLLIGGRG